MIIFLSSGIDLNIFSPTEPLGIIIIFIGQKAIYNLKLVMINLI